MKRTLFFLITICCWFCARGQNTNNRFADMILGLDSLQAISPIEKAHLHIDKPYYSVGDTIWIKAYVTTTDNKLSTLSRLLHVELLSDDSIKTHLVMPITNGQAWGAITLYDTLYTAGNFTLRAYTNVMRNDDEDYFFNRQIAIGNALPEPPGSFNAPASSQSISATKMITTNQSSDISLSFFPEGGNLISNVASVVGFKAIGIDGLSSDISGHIVDEQGNRVATFASEHAGMGTFTLFAKPGSSFTAVYTVNGTEKRVPLPATQREGYSIAVSQNKDNVLLKIISSAGINDADTVHVVAQANHEVLYTAKAALNGHGLNTTIAKSRFPNGILQVTLFDKNFLPVAERLIFIKHAKGYIQLNLTNAESDTNKPGTKRLKVTAADGNGKPVTGAFSIAVTHAGKVAYDEDNEVSVFSSLLLSSNLKGYLEQPNYYFTDTTAVKLKHLDNLLLTQGWRRFIWQDVMAGRYKANLRAPEQGDVSGIVVDERERPVAGAYVTLFIKGNDGDLLDTISDANGRFVFKESFLSKDDNFIITATDGKSKKKFIVKADDIGAVNSPAITNLPFIAYNGYTTYIDSSLKEYNELQRLGLLKHTGALLKEVKIKASALPPVREVALKRSANLSGPGKANTVLTFLDLLPCGGAANLGACLTMIGKLNGITIEFNPGRNTWVAYGRHNGDPREKFAMGLVVDGAFTDSYMGPVSEIASVEILKSLSYSNIYGGRGSHGMIIITTKTGDIDYAAYEREFLGGSENEKKGKLQLSSTSFAPRREFYTPVYNAAKPPANINLRSTIYWQPNVVTDENGTATFEFVPGNATYRIILEGVGLNGQLGRTVLTSN